MPGYSGGTFQLRSLRGGKPGCSSASLTTRRSQFCSVHQKPELFMRKHALLVFPLKLEI